MNDPAAWRLDLAALGDRLALGLDLFGAYAVWLWAFPIVWGVTLISLWFYMAHRQRRSDRAYLAYASHHLPMLSRIAKHRAHEVAWSKTIDHDPIRRSALLTRPPVQLIKPPVQLTKPKARPERMAPPRPKAT